MAGSGAAMRLYEFRERPDASTAEPRTPRVTRAGRDVRGLYPGELGRVHLLHPEDLGRGHLLHSSGSHQAPTSACRRSGEEEEAKEEVYQRSFDLQVLRSLEVQRHLQAPPRPPETSYLHHYGRWSPLVPPRSRVSCSPPSHC